MAGFNWDRYKSDFVKFEEVGDNVKGEVLEINEGRDFNGNPCPQLVIETDDGTRTLTAGQKQLQARLAEKRPEIGDEVSITYSGVGEGKPGFAPAKLFTVEVTRSANTKAVSASDL